MFIRCSNGQKCKQKKNGFEECVCNSINNFETTFGRKKKKALKCLLYVRQHWIWSDPSIINAGLQRHGRKEKMKMMHFLFSISVKYLHHWNRQLLNNGYAANFMCMCESSIENAFRWTWLTNKQNNRKILKKSTNNALENITKGKKWTNKQANILWAFYEENQLDCVHQALRKIYSFVCWRDSDDRNLFFCSKMQINLHPNEIISCHNLMKRKRKRKTDKNTCPVW